MLLTLYYVIGILFNIVIMIAVVKTISPALKRISTDRSMDIKDRLKNIIRYHDLTSLNGIDKTCVNSAHYITLRYNSWHETKANINYITVLLDELTMAYILTKRFDDSVHDYVYSILDETK